MNPFAESNREIRSERWVSLELGKIVLDSASGLATFNSACRSGHRAIGQQLGTMAAEASERARRRNLPGSETEAAKG